MMRKISNGRSSEVEEAQCWPLIQTILLYVGEEEGSELVSTVFINKSVCKPPINSSFTSYRVGSISELFRTPPIL